MVLPPRLVGSISPPDPSRMNRSIRKVPKSGVPGSTNATMASKREF
jgi:hypothetical protein